MDPFNLIKSDRIRLQADMPDIIVAGVSDVGCLRAINEDHIWIHDSGRINLLADGMGGHDRGADASRIALETLGDLLLPEKIGSQIQDITIPEGVSAEVSSVYTVIHGAVKQAAAVMAERNSELNLSKYMGTTVVGFVLDDNNHVFWFHVGDSRVYRLRKGRLSRLTVDHSLYAEWERAGSPGESPAKHLVTRVLGNNPEVEADINWSDRRAGDMYLLCSDGLNDMVSDKDIEEILKSDKSIHYTAEMLVSAALSAGGRDNVSVILCKII
jgi:serine/threonine protein phosphatase PrpC